MAQLPSTVRVSAPAKVLLFGEHAVVYGYPSIAASLTDLRLSVSIERVAEQDAAIELIFDDIPATNQQPDGTTSSGALRRQYSMDTLRRISEDLLPSAEDAFLPRPSTIVLERIEQLMAGEDVDHAKPLRPAVFLCCALLHGSSLLTGKHGGLRIQTSAENFPIGAGLGSSAAFSVALAGALSKFRGDSGSAVSAATTGNDQDQQQNVELINKFAFAAEVILHGSPSGVDNTVSAYGGALQFRKLPTPRYERIACDLSTFRFLIVNTRVPRSTKEQVANVRRRFDADPPTTQRQFDAIEAIIDQFITLGIRGELSEATLGQQMVQNHAILNELGVGHAKIEAVAAICSAHGMYTKLTGAGGGGCTVSLVPHALSEDEIRMVVKELESYGFQCFLSAVGGAGFRIDYLTTA